MGNGFEHPIVHYASYYQQHGELAKATQLYEASVAAVADLPEWYGSARYNLACFYALSGQTGSVQNWYISTDGGISWLVVGNTTTSYAYNNLTQTTLLKADVKYGVCPAAQSATDTITVNPLAIGGVLNSNATVCQTGNTGTITLGTYTGTVNDWESSTDNGITWSPNIKVTTAASDFDGNANGPGDYSSSTSSSPGVFPFFSDHRNSDFEIYTAPVN